MTAGFVYVIESSGGLFKIGFTNNPRKRLSMLRTSTADRLALRGVVPATREHEKEVHRLLASWRVTREWFMPCRAMQPLLDGLRPVAGQRSPLTGSDNPLFTYRVVNDLPQEVLAKQLGVSRVCLSRWESGKRQVPAKRFAQIKAVTGLILTTDDLVNMKLRQVAA